MNVKFSSLQPPSTNAPLDTENVTKTYTNEAFYLVIAINGNL